VKSKHSQYQSMGSFGSFHLSQMPAHPLQSSWGPWQDPTDVHQLQWPCILGWLHLPPSLVHLVNLGETKKQLQEADFFVVLGTCTYGEKTKCKVSTHFEAKWWQENLVFQLWDIQLRDTIQQ
jgi:hypothetical protein